MFRMKSYEIRNNSYRSIPQRVSPQLDTLRGWSAIFVLFAHGSQVFLAPYLRGPHVVMSIIAQASVMIFFVLSGFLICKSISRVIYEEKNLDLVAFAGKRLNRIYPPLVLSLFLCVVLWIIAPLIFEGGSRLFGGAPEGSARKGFNLDIISFVGSALFMNGFATSSLPVNGPLWSLSFEVWYYVVIALIFRSTRISLFLAIVVMISLGILNKSFLALSIVWFCGALIGLLHNKEIFLPKLAGYFGLMCIVIAGIFAGFYVSEYLSGASPSGRLLIGFSVFFGMFSALVLHGVVHERIVLPVFLPGTANFSYTLYITHFPILIFIYGLTYVELNSLNSIITVLSLSISLCLTFSYFVGLKVESMKIVPEKFLKKK